MALPVGQSLHLPRRGDGTIWTPDRGSSGSYDLSPVPFPISWAALPQTNSQVTVNSIAEFNAAASVAGSEITIGTGWSSSTTVSITASDIDVVLPAGISIGAIQIGFYAPDTAYSRIRIRGPVPGAHSGGRMGQIRDFGASSGTAVHTDVTIDGIDINGDSGFGGGETNQAFRVGINRLAVLNTRAIAAGFIWLGDAANVIVANSNFYHGAATRSSAGFSEGWGIRNTRGPFVIIDSRIQGTRYVNVRVQSTDSGDPGSENLYIGRSTLVAVAEGRTAWCWNNLNNGPWRGESAYIENCDIYTYCDPSTGQFGEEISINDCDYSRVRNNRFFGGGQAVFEQSAMNSYAAIAQGDHDWSVGNTFGALPSTEPAWGGPGDPTQIPLPNGLSLITGEAPNPGYIW